MTTKQWRVRWKEQPAQVGGHREQYESSPVEYDIAVKMVESLAGDDAISDVEIVRAVMTPTTKTDTE
jgi:hypothetical protein